MIESFRKVCFLNFLILSDSKVSERHLHLKSTIGTLEMENEAYDQVYFMAWVFFPSFMLIAIFQAILFILFNNKCHPFSDILEGADRSAGKYPRLGIKKSRFCHDAVYSTID